MQPETSITTHVVSSPDGPAFDKLASDAKAAVRLAHEASLLRAATHPGVVELIESEAGRLRTAMAGTRTWAQEPPRSTEGFALAIAQLAATLSDLHAAGISHGSIEPSHIINGPAARPILCSFGSGHLDATEQDRARDIAALRQTVRDVAVFASEPAQTAAVLSALDAARDLESMVRIAGDMASAPTPKPLWGARLREHRRLGARITLVLWGLGLLLALVGLHTIGAQNLPSPPLGNWDAFSAWFDETEPTLIVLTGVRLVALALTYYLIIATVLGAIDATRSGMKIRRVLPRRLEHLTHAALGAGLLSSVLAPFVVDDVTTAPSPPDLSGFETEPLIDLEHQPPPRLADRLVTPWPHEIQADDAEPARALGTRFRSLNQPDAELEPPTNHPVWTVEAGDHLWAIAEESLADEWGRSPSDPEIVEYWIALIEKNRPRLVDRDNPDLIIPGQIIELPPIGVDPAG